MKSMRVVVAIVAVLGIGLAASVVVGVIENQRKEQALKDYRDYKKRGQLRIEGDIRMCRSTRSVLDGTYVADRMQPELWRDIYLSEAYDNIGFEYGQFLQSLEQYGSTFQSPYSRDKINSAFNEVRASCSKRNVDFREIFQ